MTKFKIGDKVKIKNFSQSPLPLDFPMNYSSSYYKGVATDKLYKLYPTWGDLVNKTGTITKFIEVPQLTTYYYINLTATPDLYVVFGNSLFELNVESPKIAPNNSRICNCDFSVIWSSGCQCGGV